ncbi:hypothetical protein RP20_CCG004294 [Aedes albopictus]|nr:hypothetical protein RP20_CCG004294 [Aedes albopictus]
MDFRQNPLIQDSEDLHEIVVEEVDEGAVETIQLLSSFGVAEDVISALIENGYNLETLKIVERQELEEVVQKPYLADRTKLVHGLNNWRKSLVSKVKLKKTGILTTLYFKGLTPVSSISPAQEREEVLRRETLTATLLLNKSSKGKQVLAIYNECKILTKAQKKAVTHIIVDEFKDKFGTLTSVELTRLPAELHSIFPTEPELKNIIKRKRGSATTKTSGIWYKKNTRDWLSATLIVYILPSVVLTLPNKTKWKPSYLEARDSFIMWMKSLTELEKHMEGLTSRYKSKGIALAPFVIVVAENLAKPSVFLVNTGGVFYQLPTFLKALDVCFKIFKAYDIPYPRESAGAWNLIGHCLYGFSPEAQNQTKVLSVAANIEENV